MSEEEREQEAVRRRIRWGEVGAGLGVQAGIPDIDYLDDLAFPEYIREFRKVANHPQVAKELRANTWPIVGAEWTMEAASDTPRDKEIAEFCAANILNDSTERFGRAYWQRESWRSRCRDILRFLQNGFALFQRVYRRQGRFLIYDTVKYLMPESIEEWHFDSKDRFTHVKRSYIDARGEAHHNEILSADTLVVYTFDKEGANILGKPLIRPMWGPYRMISQLEKAEVIGKMKIAAGVPFFQLQENPDDDDERDAENLLKAVRAGRIEKTYVVMKHGQDMGWKEGGGVDNGIRTVIQGKEEQIAKVGMSTMSELGLAESGSRGTAGAKSAFESMSHTAIAETIAEQEARLIRELVDLNYPGVSEYPTLSVQKIDPFEQTRNIPAFILAIRSGAVLADLETENEIRRRYGFMERAPGSEPPPGPRFGGPERFNDPNEEIPDPGAGIPSSAKVRLGGRMARKAERVMLARAGVEPERIRDRLESYEARYLEALRKGQDEMRSAVVADIEKGDFDPKKPLDVRIDHQVITKLKGNLREILADVIEFGRKELRAETDRQAIKAGKIKLQDDPTTREDVLAFAREQAEVTINIDVDSLITRLQRQALQLYRRLRSQNVSGQELIDEIRSALRETSEAQIRRQSRGSTADLFNEGRNASIQEVKAELQSVVVRTEILDENTCDPCEDLRLIEVEIDSPEYRKFKPPAFCDGGEQCRGFYVAFPR